MKRKALIASTVSLVWLLTFVFTYNTNAIAANTTNSGTVDNYPLQLILNDSNYRIKAYADTLYHENDMRNYLNEPTVLMNPAAVDFVENFRNNYSNYYLNIRAKKYAHLLTIENILEGYGLPAELKYLAVIESKLNMNAVSKAGAVGPWQFMPATAKYLGLKIAKNIDERKDIKKSTHAAAKYLRDLYNEYGDWLLVLAAYNGGPGSVNKAIRLSGSKDFWALQQFLPRETRNHVKKYIATHYIYEDKGSLVTLTREETIEQIGITATYLLNRKLSEEEKLNVEVITVDNSLKSDVIAGLVDMELKDFDRYNPKFDKYLALSEVYDMYLPSEKMHLFVNKKDSIQPSNSETAAIEGYATK